MLALGMKYPIKDDYIDKKWNQRPGGYRIPRYGVAHDTGNPGSTARQNVNYFNSRNLSSSVHAFVDDNEIIIDIPLTEKAYHVRSNVSDANQWAVGVELCYGGEINFQEAYKRYVYFWAYLCDKFHWNPQRQIIGHYKLDPTRRSDPINALSQHGISYEEFLSDVQAQLKGIDSLPKRPVLIVARGDRGDKVTKIQQDLKTLGFYEGTIDGIYGPRTEAAVKAFQRKADILVDGIVGPVTAGAIENVLMKQQKQNLLTPNSRGEGVKNIQRELAALGYYKGKIDGHFGPKTEAAVKAFQSKAGIQVDGIVGPVTKEHLTQALQKQMKKKPKPTPPVPGPDPDYLYKVQIGAFQDLDNAQALKKKAEAKGFNAVILKEDIEQVKTGK